MIKDAITIQSELKKEQKNRTDMTVNDGYKLKQIIKEIVEELNLEFNNYSYKCSIGQGRLSETPWITISNPEASTSTSTGYYIVILFDATSDSICIGLELAAEQFTKKYGPNKKTIAKIAEAASLFRGLLDDDHFIKNFSVTNPVLGYTRRAKEYAAGLIAAKMYRKSELHLENIIGDINMLIRSYELLHKNKVGGLSVLNIINEYKKNVNYSSEELIEKVQKKYFKEINYETIPFIDGKNNTNQHQVANEKSVIPIARSANKSRRDQQEKTGDHGENIVVNFEKNRLIKEGREDLAKKVEKLTTDGTGYDVLSYNSDGKERLIEVKSTTSNRNRVTFMISNNELVQSKKLNNWYLYLVTNVGDIKPSIYYFYKPFGDKKNQNSLFNPIANSYKVTVNLKN
ncbi:MAG: DUF3578 domain-containing protein [Mycoplasma sp.]|nr:DUF3578 domain-containing protein [Mycoplasma sp.]